jgi:hypothetical protein
VIDGWAVLSACAVWEDGLRVTARTENASLCPLSNAFTTALFIYTYI